MLGVDERTRSVWRRTVSLGWPIAVEQTLATLMRTVDVDQIATTGTGLTRLMDLQSRQFSAVSCTNCGYTEFYRNTDVGIIVDLFLGWAGWPGILRVKGHVDISEEEG